MWGKIGSENLAPGATLNSDFSALFPCLQLIVPVEGTTTSSVCKGMTEDFVLLVAGKGQNPTDKLGTYHS